MYISPYYHGGVPDSLFSADYPERRARVPRGLPLVVALQGQGDAAGLTSQLEQFLWSNTEPEELVRFDTDELLDYRSRRPIITFDEDHFVDYSPEELVLAVAHDQLGNPFLILTGFEPDYRWERFIDTVMMLVHEFEVRVTVWTSSIPMPVPHTRPVTTTVSGTREDLIEARSVWKPRTQMSASINHVLDYRLQNLGEDVVGFAHLVPHYLANTEYPEVLLAALDGIMAATGLILSTDPVREATASFRTQVDAQIANSDETMEMVHTLEQRYDEYVENHGSVSPLAGEDGRLPTADQIASELERFLAQQAQQSENDKDNDSDGGMY